MSQLYITYNPIPFDDYTISYTHGQILSGSAECVELEQKDFINGATQGFNVEWSVELN